MDSELVPLIAVGAVLVGAAGALVWALANLARKRRRQHRLDRSFKRARRVRESGTGEQGRPYSIYTDHVWRH